MGVSTSQVASKAIILERLQQILDAAITGDELKARGVLVFQDDTASIQSLRASFPALVAHSRGTLIVLECENTEMFSYEPLRQALNYLAPIVAKEAPELLQNYAPELRAIHPDMAEALNLAPQLSIDEIALTPSERRSHRESERAFRIINGFCKLIITAQSSCPTLAGGPLIIWWSGLDGASRPALLTFRRLNHWISQARAPVLVVGTLKYQPQVVCNEDVQEGSITVRYLDWRTAYLCLLRTVQEQLFASEFTLSSEASGAVETSNKEYNLPNAVQIVANDDMAMALRSFDEERVEEACAFALRALRSATFDLNFEAMIALGAKIIEALEQENKRIFDEGHFAQFWGTLAGVDNYVALEFAVGDIHDRRGMLLAAWKAVALAHTFLEHHRLALECYEFALSYADTAHMRAQLFMYLGLIAGKRLQDGVLARDYLGRGFEAIEGLIDSEANLERGWLYNVSALMNYQEGRYKEALKMVQDSALQMKTLHHSKATHLKVNLISNISVLQEDTGHPDRALTTWAVFQTFLGSTNELFAKHFHFRQGGLQCKSGDLAGALQSYQQSYAQAQAIGDQFHMRIAAQGCGAVSYQVAHFESASAWYADCVRLAEGIGDYGQVFQALLALALSQYRLAQSDEVRKTLQHVSRVCRDLSVQEAELLAQAQNHLQCGAEAQISALERHVVRLPNTKLNRPFYLTNLHRVGASEYAGGKNDSAHASTRA
jgi:hypothetical protein